MDQTAVSLTKWDVGLIPAGGYIFFIEILDVQADRHNTHYFKVKIKMGDNNIIQEERGHIFVCSQYL